MSEFYKYFNENMESLGLPAPKSLFGSLQAAVGNATLILSQIDKFGKTVSIGEIIGAGSKLEALGVIAGCSAAFYVGAVIGSIAVATGKAISGGVSISDVLFTANKYSINRPWLFVLLAQRPGIYNPSILSRKMYKLNTVIA